MKKIVKIGFPIACVVIIGGTFYLLNKASNKIDEASENTVDKVAGISDEVIEEKTDELTNAVISQDEVYSTVIETDEEIAKKEKIAEENNEKAISLVKKKDGERSEEVYYTNESNDEDGYIVAVRRKSTTEAIIYYIVDIENETVEVYY